MSKKTENPVITKGDPLSDKAKDMLKDEKSAEWILLKAEEFNEKFMLANATVHAFVGMSWWNRKKKSAKLFKQYLLQMHEIDVKCAAEEAELQKKLMEESSVQDVLSKKLKK